MPTVLDLAGPAAAAGIDGRSLARDALRPRRASRDRVAYSETYYPRYHYGWQHLQRLRSRQYKFIEAPTPELYDLGPDPGETTNIYRALPRRAEELRLRLRDAGEDAGGAAAPERRSLDPETLQRLAALGYVGNVIDVDPNAVLPDPKEKLPLFALMNEAKSLAGEEDQVEEAIATMREVLIASDPKIMDAHLTLGNWLMRAAHAPTRRSSPTRRPSRSSPTTTSRSCNLAQLLPARGRTQDALDALEVFRTRAARQPAEPAVLVPARDALPGPRPGRGGAQQLPRGARGQPEDGRRAQRPRRDRLRGRRAAEGRDDWCARALELEPRLRTGRFNLARIREARGDAGAGRGALPRGARDLRGQRQARASTWPSSCASSGDRQGYLRELATSVEKAPEFGACVLLPGPRGARRRPPRPARPTSRKRGLEAQPRSEARAARPLRARRRLQPARPGAEVRGGSGEGPQARGGAAQEPVAAHLSPLHRHASS